MYKSFLNIYIFLIMPLLEMFEWILSCVDPSMHSKVLWYYEMCGKTLHCVQSWWKVLHGVNESKPLSQSHATTVHIKEFNIYSFIYITFWRTWQPYRLVCVVYVVYGNSNFYILFSYLWLYLRGQGCCQSIESYQWPYLNTV